MPKASTNDMMREWIAILIEANKNMKNQFLEKKIQRTNFLPDTTKPKSGQDVVDGVYKPPSNRNENDKGDVEFIKENETQPIPIIQNSKLINSNSPTGEEFNKFDGIGIGGLKEKEIKNDEKCDLRLKYKVSSTIVHLGNESQLPNGLMWNGSEECPSWWVLPSKEASHFGTSGLAVAAATGVTHSLGVKGRRGSDSPKKGRVPMSERFLNPTPITQYNPVTNEVVKESGKEKPDVVVVNEKLDVVNENPDVVKEKPDFVKENPASVKEKPAVVKEALRYSRKVDKEAVVKNKLSLGKSNVPTKLHKDKVDKEAVADKASVQDDPDNSSSVVVSKDKRKVVNDKVLDVVAKDKPKGSASSVVVSKDKRKESSEKEALFKKDQALNVVSKDKPKGNASSELPNKKEKADIPKGKHKVHSEVPVLRSKPKPEVKAKASVCKRILSKKDHSKKKPEVDYDSSSDEVNSFDEEDHSKKQKKLKRKRNDSDSDSSSIDRETMERMINKLQKKVKKESDEECVPRKGKNKEKQLTSEEAAYQEYLSTFPSFHARTTPLGTPFVNYGREYKWILQVVVTWNGQTFALVIRKEGAQSLYLGLTPALTRAAAVTALQLATYDEFKWAKF
ncbi:peptidase C48, SUMO/sentrin/Ubl1 [Tanacetum coccineum]